MSRFYIEDLVELKHDSTITGLVCMTWSDVEEAPTRTFKELYFHSSTPVNILSLWRKEKRLVPGCVIVEFMLPGDGFCLVQEDSLNLRDRSLFLGSIVKRNASDQQSGRVMSVSAKCTLQPVCSVEDYIRVAPQDSCENEQAETPASSQQSNLVVAAGDICHCQDFLEGDEVIYQDSIGLVTAVHHEVTLRLKNGSVVVVEAADGLEIPLHVPGSSSHRLAQRLGLAGYRSSLRRRRTTYVPHDSREAYRPFFPGQYVQTKKGNLRRGRWKFGAYDPNIEPRGLIVDVRVVEVHVEILYSDQIGKDSITLHTDDIEHGKLKLVDKSRLPSNPIAKALPDAAIEIEEYYGCSVRLRDTATIKFKQSERSKTIPRTDTQGYDMNVFLVTSTQSRVLICWQDGSISSEETTSLIPLVELDQLEVWPGDKVSLSTDQIELDTEPQDGILQLHAHTVGVVQTVNSVERLAKVRWFQDSNINIGLARDSSRPVCLAPLEYGTISDQIGEVSLYELSPSEALEPNLGDLVLSLSSHASSNPQVSDPWGEVIELCADGDVILRCFNNSEPYDLKLGPSKLMVIHGANMEEDWSDSYDNLDDEDDYEEENLEPVEVQFEYQGGNRIDVDGDEDAWSTDDDMSCSSPTPNPKSQVDDNVIDPQQRSKDQDIEDTVYTTENKQRFANNKIEPLMPHCVTPSSFQILGEDPPQDHHYMGGQCVPAAILAKAITKQYRILQSSLPEGIFVRTWESRLDLLRVLIVGPIGTPYEHAPYLFDMYLPETFPDDPPIVFFHSWDNNLGRINPNLYEDGKVCLSLLGTWPADEKSQGWSKRSTILQVLVSIAGLILVKEPYYSESIPFNECGPFHERVKTRINHST